MCINAVGLGEVWETEIFMYRKVLLFLLAYNHRKRGVALGHGIGLALVGPDVNSGSCSHSHGFLMVFSISISPLKKVYLFTHSFIYVFRFSI